MPPPRDPIADLKRIGFLLEAAQEPGYRVRAFRSASASVASLGPDELGARAAAGTLRELPGIGEVTERTILESLRGEEPVYLRRLEAVGTTPLAEGAAELRAALRGDCHAHTEASDGGASIREMAESAIELGHSYLVISDHSPRLTVANGLSPERLRAQLAEIAALNVELSPFRLLTGIEVDINEDGSLDQDPELLAELDVVVGSVHSALRSEERAMTVRMVTALANPHLDILGHCTGRMKTGKRTRPPSAFDAELVFAAAARFDKAIEVNSRPERLDPPKRLLRLAVEAGCRLAIDSDAHAPGQLFWLGNGCERAFLCGVTAPMVVNTLGADDLLAWTASHHPG
ncbi:MAG TPA: PHP domain-containing protein [Candidatus Limnocylindrales bacterium]|nr:PHP domain-containing protein [Candidatus Limnocylindrales bacterium]